MFWCGRDCRFGVLGTVVTIKVDIASTIDEARRVDLKDVWNGLARPLSGVERIESRGVPMGKDKQRELSCSFDSPRYGSVQLCDRINLQR